MASLLQVETALMDLIALAVYPEGVSQPSVVGVDVNIVIGFPIKKTLDDYLRDGKTFVSVYPVERMDRNTTRYSKAWESVSIDDATISLDVDDNGVTTVNGTITAEQIAVMQVDGTTYSHAVLLADTLDTIAAALGVQIPGAVVVANVITISGAIKVTSGVSVAGTAVREIKRQQKLFCISIWSPTPDLRDTLGEAIDIYMADLERFVLPDEFFARIVYNGSLERDDNQVHRLYRRDLDYLVEYATTETKKFNTLVVTELQLEDNRTTY